MKLPEKTFIIFRKKVLRAAPQAQFEVLGIQEFFQRMQQAENPEQPKASGKDKVTYQFVKTVTSLKEVAEIVRAAPLEEYVLFEGIMHAISAPIQVLVDGKSVDTMDAEWRDEPGIIIPEEVRNLQINEEDANLVIPPRKKKTPPKPNTESGFD